MVLLGHTKTKVKGERSVHVAASILNLLTLFIKVCTHFPMAKRPIYSVIFAIINHKEGGYCVSDVYVFVCQDLIG